MTTRELLAALDGKVTYRQLDHWLLRRMISIEHPARGSGTRRQFSDVEAEAIAEFAGIWTALVEMQQAACDGTLFAKLVAELQEATA